MRAAKLLIIHQGALGDFILTFPAITRLQKYFNPIDVICQNQLGQLAQALGLAKNCYPLEAACFASLFSDRINPQIKAILAQYNQIILFTLSDHLEQSINRVSGTLSCRLPPKPPADQRIHVAQYVLDRISACGLITKADAKLEDITLSARPDHPQNPHQILLHPGAGSSRKRWPLANFLQVEAALNKAGLETEFVLGPAEEGLLEELRHLDRSLKVLPDLLELLELYNSCGGYIGNDSGASHLAAYSGLPTTVIFGPADPERWKPVGRAVEWVHPPLECRPCFETGDVNCFDPKCLMDIQPEMVIEAFYRVYKNFVSVQGFRGSGFKG